MRAQHEASETYSSPVEVVDGSKGDLHVASTVVKRGERILWISTVSTLDPRKRQRHYETAIFDIRRGANWLDQESDGTTSVHSGIRGLRLTIHPGLMEDRRVEQGTRPAALRRHERTLLAARRALGANV